MEATDSGYVARYVHIHVVQVGHSFLPTCMGVKARAECNPIFSWIDRARPHRKGK